jgi:hypothetical protein
MMKRVERYDHDIIHYRWKEDRMKDKLSAWLYLYIRRAREHDIILTCDH